MKHSRPPIIRAFLGDSIIADNFAGGGGASAGIEDALGRAPDLAINHDPEAIAMHAANHPETRHFIESVWAVDPRVAAAGRRVALAWFSPDCKHHSKAKGGKPREQKIRGLAWVAVTWAQRVRPGVIVLENVEEFRDWGPLHRQHTDGCTGEMRERRIDGRSRETVGCRPSCKLGKPIARRRGETFRAFVCKLERLGYVVEHRLLRACDYGAPTTRRRLFLIARADGRPIVWPAPTHGPENTGRPHRHRTAAEIIDWSLPCPSIFDRERPLADKTMARIARGVRKFVLESARPFVIPVNHGGTGRRDHRVHDVDAPMPTVTAGCRGAHAVVQPILVRTEEDAEKTPRLHQALWDGLPLWARGYDEKPPTPVVVMSPDGDPTPVLAAPTILKAKTHGGGGNDAMSADEPLRTVTASKRGEFAIAVPYLVHRSNGERPATATAPGQAPRIYDPEKPLGTIVAQGQKHALCTAFLAKHYSERPAGGWNGGAPADAPMSTITTQDHHSVVAAHLTKLYGTSTGADLREPAPTVTGGGQHIGAVAAHLVRYNGDRPGAERVADLEQPLGTQDTTNRYALVASFLARYNGESIGQPPDAPIGTVDTRDRYSLVTVTIDGEQYVIVDIGMRMLTPEELKLAQGFDPDYVIAPVGPKGKRLTKTAQIRMIGNSVCPPIAAAIVRAQFEDEARPAA